MHPLAELEHEHAPRMSESAIIADREATHGRGNNRDKRVPIGAPPCDGCAGKAHCKDWLLACQGFYNYVETGRWDKGDVKEPTRAMYRRSMAVS